MRIIKEVDSQAWVHLFRETMGAEIVRADPTIMAAFKVMKRLDLEDYNTRLRYMRRYAIDVIELEQKAKDL